MDDLLNLFFELFQSIIYSKFYNEKKPFARYVGEARKLSFEDGRILIDSLREKDWLQKEDGVHPSYLLFKGKNHFSPYVLDECFRFIQRLYNIRKPEEFKTESSLLVKLNS